MATQVNQIQSNAPQAPDYRKFIVDMTKTIDMPRAILRSPGEEKIPIFTESNMSLVKGDRKTGKSFLLSYLMQLYLDQNPDSKFMYIDTEQSQPHIQKLIGRVYNYLGKNERIKSPNGSWGWTKPIANDPRILPVTIRAVSKKERKKMLVPLIEEFKPDLVFIDGTRDLIGNFNDENETQDLIDMLLAICDKHKTHLCHVLHTNKNDSNSRGHLGHEIENKAECIITVEKRSNIRKCVLECRDETPPTIYFKIEDGVAKPAYKFDWDKADPTDERGAKSERETDEMHELFNTILEKSPLKYTQLESTIIAKTGKSARKAKDFIYNAKYRGIIVQLPDKRYTLPSEPK